MNNTKTVLLGVLASALTLSVANGQGLLGERYLDVNAGYERFKVSDVGFSATLDGWGAGISGNFPLLEQPGYGVDLIAGFDYIRGSDSGVTLSLTQAGAGVRGFMPIDQAIKPYAGVGVDYFRGKVSVSGFGSVSDSSLYIPVEAGIEFITGPFSLTPFFTYAFSTEGDWDDYWALGAKAAYWLDNGWGVTGSITHTDYDDGIELLGIRVGVIFAY